MNGSTARQLRELAFLSLAKRLHQRGRKTDGRAIRYAAKQMQKALKKRWMQTPRDQRKAASAAIQVAIGRLRNEVAAFASEGVS